MKSGFSIKTLETYYFEKMLILLDNWWIIDPSTPMASRDTFTAESLDLYKTVSFSQLAFTEEVHPPTNSPNPAISPCWWGAVNLLSTISQR